MYVSSRKPSILICEECGKESLRRDRRVRFCSRRCAGHARRINKDDE